jgi:hypothetical protein
MEEQLTVDLGKFVLLHLRGGKLRNNGSLLIPPTILLKDIAPLLGEPRMLLPQKGTLTARQRFTTGPGSG